MPTELSKVYVINTRTHRQSLGQHVERGLSNIVNLPDTFNGRSVLIKPNFCGPGSVPHRYSMTDLDLIDELSRIALHHGAVKVVVADHPAGYVEDTERFYSALNIWERANRSNFRFMNLRDYDAGLNTAAYIFGNIVIINTTIPKTHHQSGGLSLCLKNLGMGLMSSELRSYYHQEDNEGRNSLDVGIADVNRNLRNNNTVIDILDGRFGQEGWGPHFGEPIEPGFMIFGTDPVGVDATGARFMGFNPIEIPFILSSSSAGLGNIASEVEGDDFKPIRFKRSPLWGFDHLGNWEKMAVYLLDETKGAGSLHLYDLGEKADGCLRYYPSSPEIKFKRSIFSLQHPTEGEILSELFSRAGLKREY